MCVDGVDVWGSSVDTDSVGNSAGGGSKECEPAIGQEELVDSEDEKRIFKAEKAAERKSVEEKESCSATSPQNSCAELSGTRDRIHRWSIAASSLDADQLCPSRKTAQAIGPVFRMWGRWGISRTSALR